MCIRDSHVDGLLPPEIAAKAEDAGVAKARMPFASTFLLSILAGAFVAMGAVFYIAVTTGGGDLPYGVGKLVGGVAFCVGLIMVVVAGAEPVSYTHLDVYKRQVLTARPAHRPHG